MYDDDVTAERQRTYAKWAKWRQEYLTERKHRTLIGTPERIAIDQELAQFIREPMISAEPLWAWGAEHPELSLNLSCFLEWCDSCEGEPPLGVTDEMQALFDQIQVRLTEIALNPPEPPRWLDKRA